MHNLIMDSLLREIIDPVAKKTSISLPPIFGVRLKCKKKQRSPMPKKQTKRNRLKILYDVELRSKASSVLSPRPPKYIESTYKTSRLSHLSLNFIKSLKNQSLRSSLNQSSINSIKPISYDLSRVSYDQSRILRESSFHLPMITKSSVIDIEENNNGLCLNGNKKSIIKRTDYYKATEEMSKKKVHKEIALGTDMLTEGSEKASSGRNSANEFLRTGDKSNMRRSSFIYKPD